MTHCWNKIRVLSYLLTKLLYLRYTYFVTSMHLFTIFFFWFRIFLFFLFSYYLFGSAFSSDLFFSYSLFGSGVSWYLFFHILFLIQDFPHICLGFFSYFHLVSGFSYFFLFSFLFSIFLIFLVHILFLAQDFPDILFVAQSFLHISFLDTVFLTLDLYNISLYFWNGLHCCSGTWWGVSSVLILFSLSHFLMPFYSCFLHSLCILVSKVILRSRESLWVIWVVNWFYIILQWLQQIKF